MVEVEETAMVVAAVVAEERVPGCQAKAVGVGPAPVVKVEVAMVVEEKARAASGKAAAAVMVLGPLSLVLIAHRGRGVRRRVFVAAAFGR